MQYNEVVNKENKYTLYLCKLTNGSTVELQVHDTCEFDNKEVFVFYNFEDNEDSKAYFEEDVAEVIELIEHELWDGMGKQRSRQLQDGRGFIKDGNVVYGLLKRN